MRLTQFVRSGLLDLANYAITEYALDDANDVVTQAGANAGPYRMTVIRP